MAPTAEARFTRLYETHYSDVLGYCTRRVSRAAAEDAANEVFVVLWRRIAFDPSLRRGRKKKVHPILRRVAGIGLILVLALAAWVGLRPIL